MEGLKQGKAEKHRDRLAWEAASHIRLITALALLPNLAHRMPSSNEIPTFTTTEISDSPSLIELYSEILRLILGKQKLQQVEVSLRICYHSFAQTKIGFVDPQLTVRG